MSYSRNHVPRRATCHTHVLTYPGEPRVVLTYSGNHVPRRATCRTHEITYPGEPRVVLTYSRTQSGQRPPCVLLTRWTVAACRTHIPGLVGTDVPHSRVVLTRLGRSRTHELRSRFYESAQAMLTYCSNP